MSTINTNAIDANYPVPGQNNSTQGFRNNFAAIKQNLNIAGNEITDLQNKVVLKSALANSTLNNDMANALISNASTLGFRATTYNLGNALTDLVTIDLTLGDVQYGNLAGNIFLNFGSWAPTGTVSNVTLQFGRPNTMANFSITFPSEAIFDSNYGWNLIENGSYANNLATISFPYNVTQLNFIISTNDCGNSLYIEPINRPFKANQLEKRTPPLTGQLGDTVGTIALDVDQAVPVAITSSIQSDNTNSNTIANTGYFIGNSTSTLYPGMPVVFTGSSFEPNIVSGATYYVSNIANSTHFKISSDYQIGSNINLLGGNGNIMLNPLSYAYIAVDNYNATEYNKNILGTIAPNTITLSSSMGNVLPNLPVIFTGEGTQAANANITPGKVYYIKSTSGSNVTISETIDNGIAGPTYEGVKTFLATVSLPIDMSVYDGDQIFRKVPLFPGTEVVTSAVIPNVADIRIGGGLNGYFLQTDGTGNLVWSAGGGSGNGVVAGTNTQVQFNNAGSFGGAAGFTFDKTSNLLSVPGGVTAAGNIQGANINALGRLNVAGTLDVAGDTTLLGNLDVLANVTLSNVTVLNMTANANVIANAVYALNLVSSAANGVFGNVQTSGAVQATGAVITTAGVQATGNSLFSNVDASGQVAVSGNIFSNTNFYVNGFYISSVDNTITGLGSTQTDAYQIIKSINIVVAVPAGSGVKLPVAQAGMRIIVNNTGAATLKVYPNTGAAINALGTNNPYSLTASTAIEFYCGTGGAGQWYTL